MVRARLEDHINPRPVRRRDTLFRGRIWNIVRESFSLHHDHANTLTREYVDHPGAVAVVALNDAGELLMVRQYRHPVQSDEWEIPAGLLDIAGEGYVEAAARELAEETDRQAKHWRVLVDAYLSPGSSTEAVRIYLATGITTLPKEHRYKRTEEEAEMLTQWFSVDEAFAAVLQGRLHNGTAAIGICALAAFFSRGGDFALLRSADSPWPEHRP